MELNMGKGKLFFLTIWKNLLYIMAGPDFILNVYLDLSQ